MKGRGSFSLTELLVVIAMILIVLSLLIVTTGQVYMAAQRLACQHRLEQIGQACQMFSSQNQGRELRCLDFVAGGLSGRWYEKLMPLFGSKSVSDGRAYVNCPVADPVETSTTAATGGRGQNVPILIYTAGEASDYNRYYQLRDKLNTFWAGRCQWTTWKQTTNPDNLDDNWLWNNNGLDAYSEFWFFGTVASTNSAFGQTGTPDPNPERLKEFRERGGGGLFLVGDHSDPTPDANYQYNWGLNQIANCCRLGLYMPSGRPHDGSVTWSGHYIGTGLAASAGPAAFPPGAIKMSVGRVTYDNRANDERKARQQSVAFPIVCCGVQPAGSEGISYPSCEHEQPCGLIGVLDDGLGRVCIDDTFTRWYDTYAPFTDPSGNKAAKLNTFIEQVAVWLSGGQGQGGGGSVTYGYNNLVGLGPGGQGLGMTVPEPRRTIRALDYKFYAADHDGQYLDDDITCIAPRHGGRANVLFVDGHVEALTPDQIIDPKLNLWTVRK